MSRYSIIYVLFISHSRTRRPSLPVLERNRQYHEESSTSRGASMMIRGVSIVTEPTLPCELHLLNFILRYGWKTLGMNFWLTSTRCKSRQHSLSPPNAAAASCWSNDISALRTLTIPLASDLRIYPKMSRDSNTLHRTWRWRISAGDYLMSCGQKNNDEWRKIL